jgi:hypothetical protein
VAIPWAYIYRDQPEREIQLIYAPMVEYINTHLERGKDKVYDFADLMVFGIYCDIDLFNGRGDDGPAALGQWAITSPDALEHFRSASITHVVTFSSDAEAIRRSSVGPHLTEIARVPSVLHPGQPDYDEILYRVVY